MNKSNDEDRYKEHYTGQTTDLGGRVVKESHPWAKARLGLEQRFYELMREHGIENDDDAAPNILSNFVAKVLIGNLGPLQALKASLELNLVIGDIIITTLVAEATRDAQQTEEAHITEPVTH